MAYSDEALAEKYEVYLEDLGKRGLVSAAQIAGMKKDAKERSLARQVEAQVEAPKSIPAETPKLGGTASISQGGPDSTRTDGAAIGNGNSLRHGKPASKITVQLPCAGHCENTRPGQDTHKREITARRQNPIAQDPPSVIPAHTKETVETSRNAPPVANPRMHTKNAPKTPLANGQMRSGCEVLGLEAQPSPKTGKAVQQPCGSVRPSDNLDTTVHDVAADSVQSKKSQAVGIDLIHRKAKECEGMMRVWSKRELEVAEYKEKKRKAKEMARLERQTKRERDIVSAAIDAVLLEQPKEYESSTMGISPESGPDDANKSPTRTNAFSMMMGPQAKGGGMDPKGKALARTFQHYIDLLGKALESTDCNKVGDKQWAKLVQKSISGCIQSGIFSRTDQRSSLQTRINALNTIMEIAAAVAYAKGSVADKIKMTMPGYLTNCLSLIAETMSEVEAKRVLKDETFMGTLKELRMDPLVAWEGDTWNGLDDVLRVLKDPGPVDFRRVFKKVKDRIQENDKNASSSIIKSIRREVADYITHDTCFETKYNALNVLADIGLAFIQGTIQYPRKDTNFVIETLCVALLKVGEKLRVLEIQKIVEEFRMDEDIPNASLSNSFDQLLIPDADESIYHRQFESCRNLVELILDKNQARKTSEYCEHSLLAKLFYIRWHDKFTQKHWQSSVATLQRLLSLLVDTSEPIKKGEYLEKLKNNFKQELNGCFGHEIGPLRESVDTTIHQVLKRASSRATYESRMNALKILTIIGLGLVRFLDPTKPFWQTRIFNDHITEDSLTDAMRSICHSLVKEDTGRLLSDEELKIDLLALDNQRLQLADALPGLEAVMDLINSRERVENLLGGWTKASRGRKRKVGDVVNLTDCMPAKRAAPASNKPYKVVPMIDLTCD